MENLNTFLKKGNKNELNKTNELNKLNELNKTNKLLKKLPDEIIFLIQKYTYSPQSKILLDSINKYPSNPTIIKTINMFLKFHYILNVHFKNMHSIDETSKKVKNAVLADSYDTAMDWLSKDLLKQLNINEGVNAELSRSFFKTLQYKKLIKHNGPTVHLFFKFMKEHGNSKTKIITLWEFMTDEEIKMYLDLVKNKLKKAKRKISNVNY